MLSVRLSMKLNGSYALLSLSLTNFYKRRKTDMFVGRLIKDAKDLIAEAQRLLDQEIAGELHVESADEASDPVF